MPTAQQILSHRKPQDAAKLVLDRLPAVITSRDTEQSIASKAHEMLRELGFPDTWYYHCPALVLLGSRSCRSDSGKIYQPSNERVGSCNLITIDLSPIHEHYWGDCARTFPVENGRVALQPELLEFKNGLYFLEQLHHKMMRLARPDTTFSQLFEWTNVRIREGGFVNLDYRSNVGHSIAMRKEDRQFIQADNQTKLGDVGFFSFEPFVRLKGGSWGFKHEDLFFFNQSGQLERL